MRTSPLAIFTAGLQRTASQPAPQTSGTRHPHDRFDGFRQLTHLETLLHIWTPKARRRIRELLNMKPTEPVTLEDAQLAVERATAKERTFRVIKVA